MEMHRHGQLNISTRGLGGGANTDPAVEPRMAGMKSGRRALEFPWISPWRCIVHHFIRAIRSGQGKSNPTLPLFHIQQSTFKFALCDFQGMHLMEVTGTLGASRGDRWNGQRSVVFDR